MAIHGGKTPQWAAKPTTKAKPTKVVRKKAKAKKPKKATQRSYGKILTTSLGMATALTLKWRRWSGAEKRMRFLKALDMNKEAAEARPALQEEKNLLPAYINKAMLAFRQMEKDIKKGAYASVCLETQLKVQPKLGVGLRVGRSSTSLLTLLQPRKRKRSAVGGATSPERSPEAAAVNINNEKGPAKPP